MKARAEALNPNYKLDVSASSQEDVYYDTNKDKEENKENKENIEEIQENNIEPVKTDVSQK